MPLRGELIDRIWAVSTQAQLLLTARAPRHAERRPPGVTRKPVGTPEAYAVPAGARLLVAGYAHRRRHRDLSSWAAYSGGLATLLVPSTIAVFGDRGLVRPTLLGAAALAVLLLGLRRRLQAPLLFGGAVLAFDAVVQLRPYLTAGYDATPRWVLIGAAGLLLLGVGITYERRLRDLRRLRQGFGRMA